MKSKYRIKKPIRFEKARSRYIFAIFLTVFLGVLITTAINQNDTPEVLSSAREDELVLILDDLVQQTAKLETEMLEQTRILESLNKGSNEEARLTAQKRLDQLILLAGTAPVSGAGIQVLISGDIYSVSSFTLLDAVQELRDAGAVAIEINGNRIINSSYFTDGQDGIKINENSIRGPYTIKVLGDPETLTTALKIPGGMAETITTSGGSVNIATFPNLEIDSSVALQSPQYAVPKQ
jgi:uncharacterized protein YlxW (UPF0749 family)